MKGLTFMIKANATRRQILECKRCGHSWEPIVVAPRACPNCTSYLWNKPPDRRRGKWRSDKYSDRESTFKIKGKKEHDATNITP